MKFRFKLRLGFMAVLLFVFITGSEVYAGDAPPIADASFYYSTANSDSEENKVILMVDGTTLPEQHIIIENGITFFPLETDWRPDDRLVLFEYNDNTQILFTIGGSNATITNFGIPEFATMPAPAKVVDGAVYVPLKFMADLAGWHIGYVPDFPQEGKGFPLVWIDQPILYSYEGGITGDAAVEKVISVLGGVNLNSPGDFEIHDRYMDRLSEARFINTVSRYHLVECFGSVMLVDKYSEKIYVYEWSDSKIGISEAYVNMFFSAKYLSVETPANGSWMDAYAKVLNGKNELGLDYLGMTREYNFSDDYDDSVMVFEGCSLYVPEGGETPLLFVHSGHTYDGYLSDDSYTVYSYENGTAKLIAEWMPPDLLVIKPLDVFLDGNIAEGTGRTYRYQESRMWDYNDFLKWDLYNRDDYSFTLKVSGVAGIREYTVSFNNIPTPIPSSPGIYWIEDYDYGTLDEAAANIIK